MKLRIEYIANDIKKLKLKLKSLPSKILFVIYIKISDIKRAFKTLRRFIFFNIYCYCKRYMELNIFVYVLLVFCIPYLLYSNFRIKPRKGFSILFISIISLVILLNFTLLTFIGTFLLASSLVVEKKDLHPYIYTASFITFNYEIFNILELRIIDLTTNYLFPISLVSCVFSSMMIGHWFLVDPTISKEGMKKIALSGTIKSLILLPLIYLEFIGQNIDMVFKNVILILFFSTSVLSFASFRSLGEKSYTGVMASTGLSYLSLIVSLGGSGGLLLLS